MAMIDIRCTTVEPITAIKFAEEHADLYNAVSLGLEDEYVSILDVDGDYADKITSKQDAENLIKALQKAIELNWWKE